MALVPHEPQNLSELTDTLSAFGIEVFGTGLHYSRSLSFEETRQTVEIINQLQLRLHEYRLMVDDADTSIQWIWMDCLIQGENTHGEDFFALIPRTAKTKYNYISAGRRLPHEKRHEHLSVSHHIEFAYEDPTIRERVFRWCDNNRNPDTGKPPSIAKARVYRDKFYVFIPPMDDIEIWANTDDLPSDFMDREWDKDTKITIVIKERRES